MHFHFQLANHYPFGLHRLDDILQPILAGLALAGHRVTSGVLPYLPDWPSITVLVEFFDRPGAAEEVIAWKTSGARKCLGLVCTEDLADDLVMRDPQFPRRRDSLLRVLPQCDFVWELVPGSYAAEVPPARLAFVEYGHVESLRRDGLPREGRDIDVLFYGTMNERRGRLAEALVARGLTVHATRGQLPDYIRANLMARSKLVLDVRRGEDVRYASPSRICAALQMGLTVVSERFDTSRLGALYRFTEACGFDEMVERCVALAHAPDVVERGVAARARFAAETSMVDNLRRAMDLPVFEELARA